MNTPAPQTEETLTAIGIPRWRSLTLSLVQFLGVLLALTGSADLMGVLNTLAPETAAWLTLSGAGLRFGAEPVLNFIGDLADDGIMNKSFKILPLLVLALAVSFLASCSSTGGSTPGFRVAPIDKYMCGLVDYKTSSGQSYAAGVCTGNVYVVVYEDPATKVRGAYIRDRKTGVSTLWYQAADGSWLRYSSKSGVDLGPPPVVDITPTSTPSNQ